MKKLLAVTACPTGIAHTYMAAEALQKAAKEKNVSIKVETRGSVGVENRLSEEEIAEAHAIIVAADMDADEGRFKGKPVVRVGAGAAIKDPGGLIDRALAMKPSENASLERPKTDYVENVQKIKSERSADRTGPYKHLMSGVSFMIPVVVAGGLTIACSFLFGIYAFKQTGTLAWGLKTIGDSAMGLMVTVLSGYIAFSIADRPGLAPGLIGGALSSTLGAGFLGGIFSGFLAGYLAKFLKDKMRLPKSLESLKPILIIPFLSTLVVGLMMVFVIGTPFSMLMNALVAWLKNMGTVNAILLGVIMGAMMATDMGGPINKAAYTVGTALIASSVYAPMAAVMAAGMTPPIGLAIATFASKKKFNREEKEAGKAALVLGLSFITEGAIPFAAADPFRVIPSCVVGSAIAGGLSEAFGCLLRAPHGGLFVMLIPNAVSNVFLYLIAILIGSAVTALMVLALKRDKVSEEKIK
ncbi:PTS system fructose-specific EIIB'BC component [Caprobacter fermentans]|uniref:PTS system fructose-specific EIIB'BC component n=1 Tax=Caproicibacter fermentans TaxID=2576756 RepID=A0A6N8HVK4_9FIRM|nr:fructose-specific PTS transporter subunit EIIC [Caproicibacter fermentans]MVB09831.1 PTS system fructose-specific EIIB'BC component [Caproicibacter fermentans]QNK42292.1 PTS transporter subunit EIIC [Caproicibacter fermentans]